MLVDSISLKEEVKDPSAAVHDSRWKGLAAHIWKSPFSQIYTFNNPDAIIGRI